jgi:hypothetical protein
MTGPVESTPLWAARVAAASSFPTDSQPVPIEVI